ncbi:MAG TPA: Na(+)-translocating NADH-quinone reductase subunit C [Thermoanaerobaculia bacterium]|nr:Na(+)-translocating NADH-quinone reductase subunit C [Thermoanaerobaculia bacterium]
MRHSTVYTVLFAAAICVVCGILVSTAAVSLAERQEINRALDRQQKVLEAAGLVMPGQSLTAEQVAEFFENIETRILDIETGRLDPTIDTQTYDYRKAALDPAQNMRAPPNNAGVERIAKAMPAYFLRDSNGEIDMLVLPIQGLGLWSTLYGFLAIDADGNTIRGITYYQHAETPGLGGEVDNPRWKALWPGRQIYDDGEPRIEVIKGTAGPPAQDPYRVDGLSGATITARGVTHMLHLWLGPEVYGPFLQRFASGEVAADLAATPPSTRPNAPEA